MKLEVVAVRFALEDKDWFAAAEHTVRYLGGSFNQLDYRVTHAHKDSIKYPQIIVYHKEKGFFMYDPFFGFDCDTGFRYAEAGTIKIINGH